MLEIQDGLIKLVKESCIIGDLHDSLESRDETAELDTNIGYLVISKEEKGLEEAFLEELPREDGHSLLTNVNVKGSVAV